MHTTHLRKVGGSTMLAVPPAFLEQLHIQAGTAVGLAVEHGCLVVNPQPKPRYTMAQLLAESDYSQPRSAEEQEWVHAQPVGGELL